MQQILYLEIPTPQTESVCNWLQEKFDPGAGKKIITPDGFRLLLETTGKDTNPTLVELSIFVWSLQRTTYLKVFRQSDKPANNERQFLAHLKIALINQFPYHYPEPPEIDLSQQSIFEALAPHYPLTVKYFQKMPQGEYDLNRVYWWEKSWRTGVCNPQTPKQVIFQKGEERGNVGELDSPLYDLIYIGGALGIIHAAVMARLGYKVLLIERLPFGRMNREWNISRDELQRLIDLDLFTPAEVESFIAREYQDGYSKFFDANNPAIAKAAILHTPKVLNVALDAEKLLHLSGLKFTEAGGKIWDETEFTRADIDPKKVIVYAEHQPSKSQLQASGRLLVDAMGSASPIAWQLNGQRTFDSVCPTVGAIIDGGFAPEVWDAKYGDVLNSHGDISRGRQLIWELFPGANSEITIYLFHYHQVNAKNPGSLLELYEDFFTILPEYRRCNLSELVWKKPTFGYIPGHFSIGSRDRTIAFDRLVAIGDAASLQSPLVFTGFGSLVRNLFRLTDLLDAALKHDLLKAQHLNQIRAYQSNISVTWLFSKGMMVPTGKFLPPERINSILNTFFGVLANVDGVVAEKFIKDRVDWLTFNGLAVKAALTNPSLLLWILDFIEVDDFFHWLRSYLSFTLWSLVSLLLGWLPSLTRKIQPGLEPRYPAFWLWLKAFNYAITDGMGKPQNPIKN